MSIAIFSLLIAFFIVFALTIRLLRAKFLVIQDGIEQFKDDISQFQEFFIAADENTPSGFALSVQAVINKVIQGEGLSLAGQEGAIKKAEFSIMRDLTEDGLSKQSPVIAMLFDQLPKKLQNKIINNPAYALAAKRMLESGMFSNLTGGGNGGGNGGGEFAKTLGKWG